VVAGRGADDAAGVLVGRQAGDEVVCAAQLERTGALQVFTLEQHLDADLLGHRARCLHRRPRHDAVQAPARVEDLVELDEICHRHLTVRAAARS
jgi:hypothetical protein